MIDLYGVQELKDCKAGPEYKLVIDHKVEVTEASAVDAYRCIVHCTLHVCCYIHS